MQMTNHTFRCSNCNAPLADVRIVDPDADISWDIIAECCHCGDKSYQKTIKGVFQIGMTEEIGKYTHVVGFSDGDKPVIIKTKKVANYE